MQREVRGGGQVSLWAPGGVAGGVLPWQTPLALSSRARSCSGCRGRDCTSLQCFTPLVTSHRLGGNSCSSNRSGYQIGIGCGVCLGRVEKGASVL